MTAGRSGELGVTVSLSASTARGGGRGGDMRGKQLFEQDRHVRPNRGRDLVRLEHIGRTREQIQLSPADWPAVHRLGLRPECDRHLPITSVARDYQEGGSCSCSTRLRLASISF